MCLSEERAFSSESAPSNHLYKPSIMMQYAQGRLTQRLNRVASRYATLAWYSSTRSMLPDDILPAQPSRQIPPKMTSMCAFSAKRALGCHRYQHIGVLQARVHSAPFFPASAARAPTLCPEFFPLPFRPCSRSTAPWMVPSHRRGADDEQVHVRLSRVGDMKVAHRAKNAVVGQF